MGIFCIIMSGFGFSLMALFIKLAGDIPSMQKGFFRNIIAVGISSIPLIKHWKNINLPNNKVSWIILISRSIFGTIGFIVSMLAVDLLGWQHGPQQFYVSAGWGIILALYALTLPACPTAQRNSGEHKGLVEAMGLRAFALFKHRRMALFFIFSMLLGVSLQITNGFANTFISSFSVQEAFKGVFFVDHANLLISLSQLSETFCILLIPFFLKRYGIKTVMLIAMLAWVLRFGLFAIGTPAFPSVIFLILSMIVYGVAFDFFNVSGSLFVDKECDPSIRSSAQGLFMLMTNGIGASVGMVGAQWVVNQHTQNVNGAQIGDWSSVWFTFAAYALVVGVAFFILFQEKKEKK